jgi:glutamine cyclotransferase
MKRVTWSLVFCFAAGALVIVSRLYGADPNVNHQNFSPKPAPPIEFAFEILETRPHPRQYFTQGWQLDGDRFFESSGLYGKSFLVAYDKNNTVLKRASLPASAFAEGLAVLNNRIFVLTWKSEIAYEYSKEDFTLVNQHRYQGEGWGLTHNGTELIMSDGSSRLGFIDPNTFTQTRSISVYSLRKASQDGADGAMKDMAKSIPWTNINELEYARDLIWANVWQQPVILAIDPQSGRVLGILNLTDLVNSNTRYPQHESLNGIAYDAARDAFWITGKLWKNRYLIAIDQNPKR